MPTEAERKKYPADAVDRARIGALEWLEEHKDGYPRSWEQEAAGTLRRGYDLYDDFEAPPIAGYEALEREGLAVRMASVINEGDEERVHFRLKIEGVAAA